MNSAMHISVGQVLHLELPHFWLPGELQTGGLSSVRTRRSHRFLGQKAMMGGDGIACFSCSETWRMFPGDAP